MKIDPNLQALVNAQVNAPSDAVQNSKTARTQGAPAEDSSAASSDGTDTVQFSQSFAEAQNLTSKLQEVPEIRTERIAMLREQIQNGTYKPAAADVAAAILSDPLNKD